MFKLNVYVASNACRDELSLLNLNCLQKPSIAFDSERLNNIYNRNTVATLLIFIVWDHIHVTLWVGMFAFWLKEILKKTVNFWTKQECETMPCEIGAFFCTYTISYFYNWRPISLSKYRTYVATKAISNRIKKIFTFFWLVDLSMLLFNAN